MTTRLKMTHRLECDLDTFWTRFLDEQFNHAIFVTDLQFPRYRLLARSDEGSLVRQRIEVTPKANMPPAIAKVLGDRFTYIEAGEFDKEAQLYRFELLPPAGILGTQATSKGTARAEATSDGQTLRVVEISFDVRVFGLGKMLERFAASSAEHGYAAHAEMANRRLRAGA